MTVPSALVKAADRRARALKRSRSWVIVEALREYLAAGRLAPHRAGLGEYRLAQLEADLRLTPEQRVLEAERTARLAEQRRRFGGGQWIRVFDGYEDYLDWKRWGDIDM